MNQTVTDRPTLEQLDNELKRVRNKREYHKKLRSTVYILVTVAAIAVLAATMLFPVLQVFGSSMEPTLENGELVLAVKSSKFHRGDVVAFYYNNKILLKRVIATAGDQVVIQQNGDVEVNGEMLEEPYLAEKSLGECDITFPYQVPDKRIFVLGDHRATSVDSRSSSVGSIADEYIVGKVICRIWPLDRLGGV